MPTHHDYDADGTIRDAMLDAQEDERRVECIAAGAAAYHAGKPSKANPHSIAQDYYNWWFEGWAREADALERPIGRQ